MLKTLITITTFLTSLIASSEPWKGYDSPKLMKQNYTYNLNALPLSGKLSEENMPWSETYMPSYKGGIAYRWMQPSSDTWSYPLYSLAQLKQMSPEQISKLSPAEKFDIYNSRFDYPTVMRERRRTSPEAKEWHGICHGWVPASLHHKEPKPFTFTSQDGIQISFASSDLKALLIYYYGKIKWKPSGWIGKKCKGGIFSNCQGVNAGTFHIVLANQLGLMKRGFVMDVDKGLEIWNQPMYGYESRIQGSTARGVLVRTKYSYAVEIDHSQWNPVGTKPFSRIAEYELELNSQGDIIGGEWIDTRRRPGFIWQHEMSDFADPYYGIIKSMTDQSLQ